jgi:hypothetical protein
MVPDPMSFAGVVGWTGATIGGQGVPGFAFLTGQPTVAIDVQPVEALAGGRIDLRSIHGPVAITVEMREPLGGITLAVRHRRYEFGSADPTVAIGICCHHFAFATLLELLKGPTSGVIASVRWPRSASAGWYSGLSMSGDG